MLFRSTFAQNYNHINGGCFKKTIEYNRSNALYIDPTLIESVSKTDVYNKSNFFGDFNARVEYLYEPSFEGASGLRVVLRKKANEISYVLEVKYVYNYKKVMDELGKKYPIIGIPSELYNSIPQDIQDAINYKNQVTYKLRYEDKSIPFKVKTISIPISDEFADMLSKNITTGVKNFKAKGIQSFFTDGDCATFSCVVDDEVWSLWIHEPQKGMLKLSDICREIITDTQNNNFNESKYMMLLVN